LPPARDAAKGARPEVALWSAGKGRVISKNWPDEVIRDLDFSPDE
jgi:hypothetical protein